ncbi:LLM class flavin-dependent oxidoreductase [Rhizobium sp. NZLR1]|uniref:LLM class flavin-dependent oxidoreductase n=1 Tax=Rhizobium sp. NZLR1 TaxID=2731096 RepID=UPI001A98412B|nr:LLM class flavin-dependent oxidoreductase [Rhizobium sp. NZLR1]MBX5204052.1 LLM class flavin-dependent oxidoreductase [Rhizobium sp. NZLR1]QSZ25150.1 LLM class flavin-dependent oxidoreductase [Rhizobium sp. NZLR1]
MQIGINSFAALNPDSETGRVPTSCEKLGDLIEEIALADQVGIDVFGVGEHHRPDFADASPAVILAAAATRTHRIRLTSAVSVLSTADPVRLFQDFATLDLLSKGRAELVVGRGSFGEAYPLFGYQPQDYDGLFAEKLDLLLALRGTTHVNWSGRFRAPLTGQGVYPRPVQDEIPVWVGVGGTPASFARAGMLGVPLMIAIIGGSFERFRPLIDLYRRAGMAAGHPPDRLKVGIHVTGFLADSVAEARDAFFPGWAYAFSHVGKERGWGPVTRDQFDASCGSGGSFLIGDPRTVIEKVRKASATLGGISRLSFQMSAATCGPVKMARSIELIGRVVAPALRQPSTIIQLPAATSVSA